MAGSSPDEKEEAALDELQRRLRSAAERYEPCGSVREAVSMLDRHIDEHRGWARAYRVLADALRLGRESCPSAAPGSKHAASADEAIRKATELSGGLDPTAGLCDIERDVRAAGALLEQKTWPAAAAAYRKALHETCEGGVIHWAGRRHALEAQARLGLAEAALESGDLLEARRQLRRLDFDRREAVLNIGDEARESAMWQRLGAAPPKPFRAKDQAAAVSELERAAVEDDDAAFEAALSIRAPDRALLAGKEDTSRYCAKYVIDRPARLRMCIATRILPEGPRLSACVGRGGRMLCRVEGANRKDVRMVELAMESGSFRVVGREDGPE